MRLLFVNGSRGEWGYIKPILDKLHEKNIEYNICATNMLLLSQHGSLVKEIWSMDLADSVFMIFQIWNTERKKEEQLKIKRKQSKLQ